MQRGRYRLQGHDYAANRWYFVTAVTAGRAHRFGRIVGTELEPSALGRVVDGEIAALPERRPGVEIAVFAILPNHVHLLIGLPPSGRPEKEEPRGFEAPEAATLSVVVGTWKAGVSRRARAEGVWGGGELWQRRFHDRLVRNGEEWNAIAEYILWNPVTWHQDLLSGSAEPTDEQLREWKRRNEM